MNCLTRLYYFICTYFAKSEETYPKKIKRTKKDW